MRKSWTESKAAAADSKPSRTLGAAAVALVFVMSAAGTVAAVAPVDGGDAGGATLTINNDPADQIVPHVSGDLAVYTTNQFPFRLHYFDFITSVDRVVPAGPGNFNFDTLADVSGSRIAFSRQLPDSSGALVTHLVVYDVAAGTFVEIDPSTVYSAHYAAIVGNTVTFMDIASGNGDIQVADVSAPTAPLSNLSASPANDRYPQIGPDGDTVVWQSCTYPSYSDCDVLRAVRSGGVWGPAQVVAGTSSYELNPDTDGGTVVYDSDQPSATGQDIYWTPVAGGPETRVSLPGVERDPSISAGVISFEHSDSAIAPADVFVYEIASNRVLRVTDTPTVDESMNDVSVLPNGDVRVLWAADDGLGGSHNIYARTFTLPDFDPTPPAITRTVAGTLGDNGWYTSDVDLVWEVSEAESPASLVETGCVDLSITTDQLATTYSCAASSDGGTTGPVDVSIKRDVTAPTITFTGSAGTYDVDQTVSIGCTATDNLSGIAAGCVGVNAPAYTFPPGPNKISTSATDNAGNTSTATKTFKVAVRPAALCALTSQFVHGSPTYQALTAKAKRVVDAAVSAACTTLLQVGPQLNPTQKAALINGYVVAVRALARSGWLTTSEAATLTALAHAL